MIIIVKNKIIAKEVFEQGEKDFRTYITKIKSTEPDLLIILGYGFHFQSIFTTSPKLFCKYLRIFLLLLKGLVPPP